MCIRDRWKTIRPSGIRSICVRSTIDVRLSLIHISHRPAGDVGGIPVVVDVVLVLVGTRDAQHDIFLPRPGPRDALRPEARHGQQHLQPAVGQIRRVAGIADVVENRVGDGAVAVDLLEGDLPLVVALLDVYKRQS